MLQAGPDEQLLHEVLQSLNASELAQRRFREIARVSGLIFQGYPGEKRSNKQLQASSSLFWEVFRKYDPANRLLMQAEQELLAQELEIGRLRASLARMGTQQLVLQTLERPTPFAFPLMVELFREKLSNENLAERIARMVAQLEKAAGGAVAVGDVEQVKGTLAFGQEGVSSGDGKGSGRAANASRPGRCPCCDDGREPHTARQAIARGLCGRNRLAAARARAYGGPPAACCLWRTCISARPPLTAPWASPCPRAPHVKTSRASARCCGTTSRRNWCSWATSCMRRRRARLRC
jgi:hypothetical protein